MELTWKMVTRSVDQDKVLEKKIRKTIEKLEEQLARFPPEAVHLNVGLEIHSRRDEFIASVTLRLPSNVLRVEKHAVSPIAAFDDAVDVLVKQLEKHTSGPRHEAVLKRSRRNRLSPEAHGARFAAAPMANGVGPETLQEIVRDLLQDHYRRFLGSVRRRVERAESAGIVFRGAIDPRGVLDEAARRALSAPEGKPEDLSYRLWIFRLIREELTRRFERLQQEMRDDILSRKRRNHDTGARRWKDRDVDQVPELNNRALEPEVAELSDILPRQGGSPEEETEHRDLLNYLHEIAHEWTEIEQHVFELHFVDGLSAFEVALVEMMSEDEVNETIASIQTRLREVLYEEAEYGAQHRRTGSGLPSGT